MLVLSREKFDDDEMECDKPYIAPGTKGNLVMSRTKVRNSTDFSYSYYHQWENVVHNRAGMRIYDERRCFVPLLKRVVDGIGMSFSYRNELIFRTFTEYRNDRGVLLRCHPDYRGSGPWYDWVTIINTQG